jgi:protein-tyrosine phosphatase
MADVELSLVYPQIYLGNFFSARSKKLLLANKISHIIVAAYELDTPYAKNFIYLKLNLMDLPHHPLLEELNKIIEFIENTLNCNSNNNILIHCAQGISRSAAIAIAYIMWKQKISYQAAYEQVLAIRPIIQPNEGFIKQLKQWHANNYPINLNNNEENKIDSLCSTEGNEDNVPSLPQLDPYNILSSLLGGVSSSLANLIYRIQVIQQQLKHLTGPNKQLEEGAKLGYQKKLKSLELGLQSLIGAIVLSQAHKHSSKSSSRSASPSLTPNHRSNLSNLIDIPPIFNLNSPSKDETPQNLNHNSLEETNVPSSPPHLTSSVSLPVSLHSFTSHAALALAQLSTEAAPQALCALAALQIYEQILHNCNLAIQGMTENPTFSSNSPRVLSSHSPKPADKSLFSPNNHVTRAVSSGNSNNRPSSRSLVVANRSLTDI